MSYCPDHDPLLLATSIICGTCKSESFPVDADWMPDGTILASFDAVHEPWCTRRPDFGMVLLVPGADPLVPRVQRPRTCRGTTRAGRPCRNPAGKASAWCSSHDPDRQGAR